MEERNYKTQRLDHLGIVSGICDKINLTETIDDFMGKNGRNVTVGEAVKALVLNCLGFVGRPLYLTPEFFRNKPINLLFRDGLKAEDFNDDSLGRCLDAIYDYGPTTRWVYGEQWLLDCFR